MVDPNADTEVVPWLWKDKERIYPVADKFTATEQASAPQNTTELQVSSEQLSSMPVLNICAVLLQVVDQLLCCPLEVTAFQWNSLLMSKQSMLISVLQDDSGNALCF
ncbi:unnamed protein product [Caretta caretta]